MTKERREGELVDPTPVTHKRCFNDPLWGYCQGSPKIPEAEAEAKPDLPPEHIRHTCTLDYHSCKGYLTHSQLAESDVRRVVVFNTSKIPPGAEIKDVTLHIIQ